jgi:hypothetical protein
LPDSRDSSRRRFDGPPSGERPTPSLSESPNDWRSNRAPRLSLPETETPSSSFKRKGSGFSTVDGQTVAMSKDESWTIGSKFKPAPGGPPEDTNGNKFGSLRGKSDMGPPKEPLAEDADWRMSTRPRPVPRNSVSRESWCSH